MSTFEDVVVNDQWLQSQFTRVELRGLKAKFVSARNQYGIVTLQDLPPVMVKLKPFNELLTQDDIKSFLTESTSDLTEEIDFESFLRAYLNLQARTNAQMGPKKALISSWSFVKSSKTNIRYTINETEKASYVYHINTFLGEDKFFKDFLPIDPNNDALFNLAKDGVLMCKLINVAVPGTIDERAINSKRDLNSWERNENHTLCLNSAKAIGCTVVNIDTQDLVEGRPHSILWLISEIVKIQLLADVNPKETPELVAMVEDNKEVEELMGLPPEKILLKWINFQLKKSPYKKQVANFSSDLKDGEAYAHVLNVLSPEHSNTKALEATDLIERANLILEQAKKMDCKRYVTAEDIVEGSENLNLAFVAYIFQQRQGVTFL